MPKNNSQPLRSFQVPANGNRIAGTFVPIGDAAKAVLAKLAANLAK